MFLNGNPVTEESLSNDLIANFKLFSAFSLFPAKTALSVFLIAFLTVDFNS